MEWLTALLREVRSGRNALVVSGAIGDGFPCYDGSVTDELRPWYEVAAKALTALRPNALFVVYDAARGFIFPEQPSASQEQFLSLLTEPKDRNASEDDDDVAQAMAALDPSRRPEGALTAPFERASGLFERLIARSNTATEGGRPLVIMIHDADALWNPNSSGNGQSLSFLRIKRLAECDDVRRGGNIILLAAPSSESLPETIRRNDSPFGLVRLARPAVNERLRFLQRICAAESVDGRDDDGEAETALSAPQIAPDYRYSERNGAYGGLWAEHLTTLPSAGFRLMTEAFWNDLRVGDIVVYRERGTTNGLSDSLKRVIELRPEGAVLSRADDLNKPHVFDDVTPVLYGFTDAAGIMQRRSASNSWTPRYCYGQTEGKNAEGKTPTHRVGFVPGEQVTEFLRKLDALNTGKVPVVEAAKDAKPLPPPFEPFAAPDCGIETASRVTGGMSYRDIAGSLRAARAAGHRTSEEDLLAARKDIIRRTFGDRLKIVEPAFGFEGIAGMEHNKRFLLDVKRNMLGGNFTRVPKNVIASGPPGTGKTALAESFARECGMPLLVMGEQRSMFHGETERGVREQYEAVFAMMPCVLLDDEADQSSNRRGEYSGDSGVSNRVRKMKMEFMQREDIQGRCFIISCSNRPDLLDAALLRADRTDEKMCFLMPDADTRSQLLDVMFLRLSRNFPELRQEWDVGDARARAVQATANRSGADIKVIVRHASEASDVVDGLVVVKPEHLLYACRDYIGQDGTSPIEIARMELFAIQSVNRESYRPKDWRKIVARNLAIIEGREWRDPDEAQAEAEVIAKTAGIKLPTGSN